MIRCTALWDVAQRGAEGCSGGACDKALRAKWLGSVFGTIQEYPWIKGFGEQ